MNFGTLVLLVVAGLAGPLLAVIGGKFVPVVIGEILAGIIIGHTGLDIINPSDPTVAFLGTVGFAMLMFTVGMHLPLRDKRLFSALREGISLTVLSCVLAVLAGLLIVVVTGVPHAAIYAVVLASGSAAVLLPSLMEVGDGGSGALTVMAWVTIADIVTILAVP